MQTTLETVSEDIETPEYVGTCSYSPEDNKLRLYPFSRLDSETYERVKAAGFKWAPKQELFVAPMWTPWREDLLIELCGEIGDEDTSLVERQEQRAERFEDLSDKRLQEAERVHEAVSELANGIPLGQPILVGHHSERRARKDAEKIKSGMRKAVSCWETAKYWEQRAKGALHHAKYKELPAVRARRIKGIEADRRKQEKNKKETESLLAFWSKPGLTLSQAKSVANYDHISRCFTLAEYPRELPASQYEGPMSLWSALDDGIINAEQAAEIAMRVHPRTIESCHRWIAHYDNRLAYERAMLDAQGGTVADRTKPEKGGACKCWVGRGEWIEIQKVNKVSVSVLDNWGNGGPDFKRTVPITDLAAVMSKADYEAYKRGQNPEAVAHDLAQLEAHAERSRTFREEVKSEEESPFAQLKDSLKAGVQVVSAPQLFPTPPEIASRMVQLADIQPGHRVLEPSAGTGNLLAPLIGMKIEVTAVEINSKVCQKLRRRFPGEDMILDADFLKFTEQQLGTFDRIVMNPPFENGADIKHIRFAASLLDTGGRLVALCANGPRQRETLMPLASYWEDLPEGSFKSQGTGVNVALLVIEGA